MLFMTHCLHFYQRIFGPEVQGKNFVYAVVKNIRNRQKVKCLKEEVSCPTYNRDLANMTLRLVEAGCSGLFHCTGPDCLSKADWGRMIVSVSLLRIGYMLGFVFYLSWITLPAALWAQVKFLLLFRSAHFEILSNVT